MEVNCWLRISASKSIATILHQRHFPVFFDIIDIVNAPKLLRIISKKSAASLL